MLAAGAAGAWVGSVLLTCPEATTTPEARTRLRAATETDTVYGHVFDIAQGLAWPPEYGGRALRNRFTDYWGGREAQLADDQPARDQLAAAQAAGDYDTAYIYAGQAVGLVSHDRSAGVIVSELALGAEQLLNRWG